MVRNILNRLFGKTKDTIVYDDGTCEFVFKDEVCTDAEGDFDPGANEACGLKIDGMGRASLALSQHFFPLLEAVKLEDIPDKTLPTKGIPPDGIKTHFISCNIEKGAMLCKHLTMLPVEFIWRSKAWGSFCRVFGVEQGFEFSAPCIEATLKDDALGDPRIGKPAAVLLGRITEEQFYACENYTGVIGEILRAELAKFGYELIDFKVEFGVDAKGTIHLADEISGGIWRILDKDGNTVDPVMAAITICPHVYSGCSENCCKS